MHKHIVREDDGFRWETWRERFVRWFYDCEPWFFVAVVVAASLVILWGIFRILS